MPHANSDARARGNARARAYIYSYPCEYINANSDC